MEQKVIFEKSSTHVSIMQVSLSSEEAVMSWEIAILLETYLWTMKPFVMIIGVMKRPLWFVGELILIHFWVGVKKSMHSQNYGFTGWGAESLSIFSSFLAISELYVVTKGCWTTI